MSFKMLLALSMRSLMTAGGELVEVLFTHLHSCAELQVSTLVCCKVGGLRSSGKCGNCSALLDALSARLLAS